MSELCGNVITQMLNFRRSCPDLEHHMMLIVCEKNQGALPSEMMRALQTTTAKRPTKICNWIMYCNKPADLETGGGVCATNSTKMKASTNIHRLLNQNPPFPCLRFYKTMSDAEISSYLTECENEVREIDMTNTSPISLHTKSGKNNDVLCTTYNGIYAYYTYSNDARVRDLSWQRTSICSEKRCRYASTGHSI